MHPSLADAPDGRPGVARRHLLCAAAALGVALAGLVLTRVAAQRQLRTRLESFAAQVSSMRMHGNLLQQAAFSDHGVLPVYGSSEMDLPAENRPDAFFRPRPTGFSVFAEGHAGTTCLMILQKIAAAGSAARGRQAVVFLSPSWFARPEVAPRTVSANLPAAQVGAWVFDSPLDPALKRRLARRLLRYPEATRDQPLLAAAVHSLASRAWRDRCVFAGLWPLGECQHELSLGLEAGTLLWDVGRHGGEYRREAASPGLPAPVARLNWARLAARAERMDRTTDHGTTAPLDSATPREGRGPARAPGWRDAEFDARLHAAEEWRDLKLMTQVLASLGVRTLFISQPMNGKFYDLDGISARGRRVYYRRLGRLFGATDFPLRDFAEHEDDPRFFRDAGHPSAMAWIYYDEQIDGFYHRTAP